EVSLRLVAFRIPVVGVAVGSGVSRHRKESLEVFLDGHKLGHSGNLPTDPWSAKVKKSASEPLQSPRRDFATRSEKTDRLPGQITRADNTDNASRFRDATESRFRDATES